GKALSAFVHAGLPCERALSIAGQIARALDYAHTHSVIHGDLTPASVLMDRRAVVRINNFGLPSDAAYFAGVARTLDGEAPTRLVSAPGAEDPRAESDAALWDATPAHDVRATGLLLWQLLAEPLRDGTGAVREFRDDVPEPVRELVRRAALPGHPQPIVDAQTLALTIEAAATEIASQRERVAELTPPALRAFRSSSASRAQWSASQRDETTSGWGVGSEGAPGRQAARTEAASARFGMAPTELAAPRFRLPSRPVSPGDPLLADAPRWPVGSRPTGQREPWSPATTPGPALNLALMIAIGVALFVLFFLIGFVLPPVFGK
ncbi:MAG: protein kinase, partial [Ktedonobacterales bacterium]